MLVIWWVNIIFTRYSTAPFGNFCIHSYSTENINLIRVLPLGCTISYYKFNAQMFLRSRRVPDSEHNVSQSIHFISWFFYLNAYLTANTVFLNLYSWSAVSSISTRTSQRTQSISTYTDAQLFLPSQRVPHSEHSVSQPILLISCFFGLNMYLIANTAFLNLYWRSAVSSISTRTSQRT